MTEQKLQENPTKENRETFGKSVSRNLFDTIKGAENDRFIAIPIEDYESLGIMKADLIEALYIINHSRDWMPPDTSITGASDAIINILKSMSIIDELNGLDKFLKII